MPREDLLAGRLPEWPAAMRAHEYALDGERDAALAQLAAADPITRYNRSVMDPDSYAAEEAAELRSALGEFGVLVDVVLYSLGRIDDAPAVGDATGELAAVVRSTVASTMLQDGDVSRRGRRTRPCRTGCRGGVRGPVRGSAGCGCVGGRRLRSRRQCPASSVQCGFSTVPKACASPRRTASHPGRPAARAGHRSAGSAGPQQLPHYHSVLQLVLREEAPLLWASAHANLATAYLTMPMTEASGQLRLGIAAQSLRSAMKVYTPDEYPEHWASVQLNLANSLVYTPSNHQADNLIEAVGLYESVLAARDRHSDRMGAPAAAPTRRRLRPSRRLRPGQGEAVRSPLPVRGTR